MIITSYILRHSLQLYGLRSGLFRFSNTSKMQSLIQKLQEARKLQTISSAQFHPVLLQFVEADINSKSPYLYYTRVKQMFELYLTEVTKSPHLSQYNPKKINEQARRLSEIAFKLSQYPRFQLHRNNVTDIYRIFCRLLNHRTDQQMSCVLMLALKVDQMVEQSVLYQQFLKFYLGEKWEVIKAKYQLDLTKESIGNIIKKMAAAVVHRGFLRRTPDYQRSLQIIYPINMIKLILANPSTSSSLLIRKLMYQHIFTPIVRYYEDELHSNLYHPNNICLWEMLNQRSDTLFQSVEILSKESSYLSELYVNLFLVLRQQQNDQVLFKWLGVVGAAYQYILDFSPTEKTVLFRKNVQDLMKYNEKDKLLAFVKLDENIFKLISLFPGLAEDLIAIISCKITPLTFYTYFDQITKLLPSWSPALIQKISHHNPQQNIFNLISANSCLQLVKQLKPEHISVYSTIIDSIVNKQYTNQPTISEVIIILQIYAAHNGFKECKNPNLATLRIFLFRFIADCKDRMTKAELTKVMGLLSDLDDEDSFSDQNGNYDKNIFQELQPTVQKMKLTQIWSSRQKRRQKTKPQVLQLSKQ